MMKIKKNVIVDILIYTFLYLISTGLMIVVELLFTKSDALFLLLFRLISMIIDIFLWPIFEKARIFLAYKKNWPKYLANVISFAIIIQLPYVVRLFATKNHWEDINMYIIMVFMSSFVLGQIMPWLKDKIKNYMVRRNANRN